MKIAVIGTGYVGLVTGTCLAEVGNEVTCIDIDKAKVAQMKLGKVPIYEPDLDVIFKRNIKENRLTFTTNLKKGITDVSVIFLALPTPSSPNGAADLSYVEEVAGQLGFLLKNYVVIINKSTVPVGTAELVRKNVAKACKVDFDVVSNPEFLREGFAVSDFMKPDRVVIGTSSNRARGVMKQLYSPFVRQGNPIYFMDERSAELTKYAANSFLATKISFMNEIANICEETGADVDMVRLGMGSDERIGKRFLFPGIGYGGSCFPKDVLALNHTALEHDYEFRILQATHLVNSYQKQRLVNRINDFFDGDLKDKVFGLWGLSFKPDTDDIREAPSLELIEQLTLLGAKIVAFDPVAMPNVKRLLKKNTRLTFAHTQYKTLSGADALIISTEWSEFRTPDFKKMKSLLKKPIIFDGRNLYDLKNMKDLGFYYSSIGRKTVGKQT